MANVLANWSFEDGWTTDWPTGNQTPNGGWQIAWANPGDAMLSRGVFSGEDAPVIDTVLAVPECVHKLQNQLPFDEWLGAPNALILDGTTVYKVFGHAFSATLWQELELTPGATATFRVPLQVHHHRDGSWGACAARIWINEHASQWATFHEGFPDPADPEWVVFTASVKLDASGMCVVGIDLEGRAEADVSFFIDAVTLEEKDGAPPSPVNYVVVAELLPQDATLAEHNLVVAQTFANKRTHLQSADDAARLVEPGLPGSKVDVWGGGRWPGGKAGIEAYLRDRGVQLIEFYEFDGAPPEPPTLQLTYPTTHMPPVITQPFGPNHGGIDLRSSWAAWGDELIAALPATVAFVGNDPALPVFGYQVLLRAEFDGAPVVLRYAHLVEGGAYVTAGQTVQRGQKLGRPGNTGASTGAHLHFSCKVGAAYVDPAPLILWPVDPIPPSGEPAPYVLRSANHIGLHSGFPRAQSWPYIQNSGVNIQKFFSAGDAYQAGVRAPGIVSIWRKFVGDPGITDPIRDQARWLVDQYTAEINSASGALGISVETLLGKITAAESLNETIPTYNPGMIQRAVEFDVRFAEELHARYGNLVAPVLLNVAIGNPHETEVHYLLPAAKASVDYKGWLGYHAYFTRNETRGFIADYWKWHAGRWMEWDDVFRAAGVYPRYALGEGGIVYAPDGVSFNSGRGWKTCGSFELYLQDIKTFNDRVKAWNAVHANRCAGLTLFGYGNWSWDNFELGDGEVSMLNEWANSNAPVAVYDVPKPDKQSYAEALEKHLSEAAYLTDADRARLEAALSDARSATP